MTSGIDRKLTDLATLPEGYLQIDSHDELVRLLLIAKDTEISLKRELEQLKLDFEQVQVDLVQEFSSSRTWRVGKFVLGPFGKRISRVRT